MRSFCIFVVCLAILTVCECQTLVYYCNFDVGLVDDCVFEELTGVSTLTTVTGIIPTDLKPTEPLSDITSIQLLTTPNNETCILPYNYPTGNRSMYFCKWNSPINFTCPTASGIGNCIIGKYAHFKADVGNFNETYLTNVSTKSSTVHCLDFFYYLIDALDEAKISVGWKSNGTTTTIVEVTASAESKWQQSRTTYISPSSEMHRIWFKMTRTSAPFRLLTYALDEIKIFEGSCGILSSDSIPSMVMSFSNTTTSDIITSQTSEIPTEFTTNVTDTISTTVLNTTTTTILDTTTSTDKTKLTTNDDIQTTTIFKTTDEEANMTTSNTSDVTFPTTTTVITSQTKSATIETTTPFDSGTAFSTKQTDLIVLLGVPLGLGFPALLITIGGLFYHYRTGQRKTKAFLGPTNTNEIPMTERNA